jgi:phosphoribosylglycinamide formyltransferase-1
MKNIAVFASGSGTNAENIIHYFNAKPGFSVGLIVCNNPNAGVIERAKKLGVPCLLIDKESFKDEAWMLEQLRQYQINFIALAGFLWLIPPYLVKAFPNGIVNIHPALLPKFGGKGMYGHKVHQSVIQSGEAESGITIHWVNEHYDEGTIIFQAKCKITPEDSPQSLASKIHLLEYEFYPKVLEEILRKG